MTITFRSKGSPQLDSPQFVQSEAPIAGERGDGSGRVRVNVDGQGEGRNSQLSALAPRIGQSPLDRKNEARPILDHYVAGQGRAKQVVLNMLAARDGVATSGLVLTGPPGSGKTKMADGIAAAVNGDPNARIHIEGARIRSTMDLMNVIGIASGYIASDSRSAALDPPNIAKTIGSGQSLILHIEEVDKIPSDALAQLARFLLPLFTSGKLAHQDGSTSDHPGAIVTVGSNDPTQGSRLFEMIRELASKQERPVEVPKALAAKHESLDRPALADLVKKKLQALASQWPAGKDLIIDRGIAAHLADLAFRSTDPAARSARGLLHAVEQIFLSVSRETEAGGPGARYELGLKDIPKQGRDAALEPLIEAYATKQFTPEALGFELKKLSAAA